MSLSVRSSIFILATSAIVAVGVAVKLREASERTDDGDRGLRGASNFVEQGRTHTKDLAKRISRAQHIAFVGNSMLGTRIDKDTINELAKPREVAILKEGNTFSAVWYLGIKQIIESPTPPKNVVVFFRDRMLTWPTFRLNDNAVEFLQGMMESNGVDPLVDRYLPAEGEDNDGFFNELEAIHARVTEPNDAMITRIEDLALDVTKIEKDKDKRRFAMSERFSMENLRHDLPADIQDEVTTMSTVSSDGYETPNDFHDALAESLLPAMVNLCRENGVRLILVRVKRRPDAKGYRESSPELDQYISDLSKWLAERDVPFIDAAPISPFTEADYADGDHVSAESRPAYTRWFWKQLTPHLAP